ncbi:MAG TPA: M13-type metalloendopeptidase [Rhizomicrobium sp.]|jgi:putative endopeptidase
MNILLAGAACLAMALTSAQAQDAKPTFGAWGVDLSGMDTSVKPGDDFFDYANGTWYKNAVIPADRTGTGSFYNLEILSETRMGDIVAGLQAEPYAQLTDEEKKIRDFYEAFVDTAQIEKRGLAPAKADLNRIAHLKTLDDVARAMGDPSVAYGSLFGAFINADAKDPGQYLTYATQAGLGMPDRDYYLKDDPALVKTRDAYKQYLATMLTLAGTKDAQKRADAVFALETQIAKLHWPAVERRDVDKTYNPMTEAQLAAFAPGFPWQAYFNAEGLSAKGPKGDRTIIVRENTAFPTLAKLYAATPVAVWRDYLTVHYLHNMAAYLPKAFDDADFDFYGKTLSGQAQQLPRATRALHLIDRRLGHPLGKLYVAKYFPPESKAKVEALVQNLLKAYDADIRKITWMSDATKQKALDKLHLFTPHVGYPDKWRDFSGLVVKRDDLVGDVERSNDFEWHYRLDRIDQPVDRNEWGMTPPTINAYYTPVLNAIFFPAAILQPPFFDPNADDAVNYGGIGAVMGHEIGHGFDDQGSKYNGHGVLESWWTDADRKAFNARTANLTAQFDTYEGIPGLHVNGKLTLGENIGDLSGMTVGLQAYHISLGGKTAPVLDGFTGDQRYFLSWAQVWREKVHESAMRAQLLADPHSPAHWRVVGPTRNVDGWYTAFDVKPGDKYYLPMDQRVHIW